MDLESPCCGRAVRVPAARVRFDFVAKISHSSRSVLWHTLRLREHLLSVDAGAILQKEVCNVAMRVKIFSIFVEHKSPSVVEQEFNDLLASGVKVVQVLQSSTHCTVGQQNTRVHGDATIITVLYEEAFIKT